MVDLWLPATQWLFAQSSKTFSCCCFCCFVAVLLADNTTIPLNLTSPMQFTLDNATCDSAWIDALIAAFSEQKRKAAEDDDFDFNFTTTLVNCTQVRASAATCPLTDRTAAQLLHYLTDICY
jgi:hypothetical protein